MTRGLFLGRRRGVDEPVVVAPPPNPVEGPLNDDGIAGSGVSGYSQLDPFFTGLPAFRPPSDKGRQKWVTISATGTFNGSGGDTDPTTWDGFWANHAAPGVWGKITTGVHVTNGAAVRGKHGTATAPIRVVWDGLEAKPLVRGGVTDVVHFANCSYVGIHGVDFDGEALVGATTGRTRVLSLGARFTGDAAGGNVHHFDLWHCGIRNAKERCLQVSGDPVPTVRSAFVHLFACEVANSGRHLAGGPIGELTHWGDNTSPGDWVDNVTVDWCHLHDSRAGQAVDIEANPSKWYVGHCLIENVTVHTRGAITSGVSGTGALNGYLFEHLIFRNVRQAAKVWAAASPSASYDAYAMAVGGDGTIRKCLGWDLGGGLIVLGGTKTGDGIVEWEDCTAWATGLDGSHPSYNTVAGTAHGSTPPSLRTARLVGVNSGSGNPSTMHVAVAGDFVGPITGTAAVHDLVGRGFTPSSSTSIPGGWGAFAAAQGTPSRTVIQSALFDSMATGTLTQAKLASELNGGTTVSHFTGSNTSWLSIVEGSARAGAGRRLRQILDPASGSSGVSATAVCQWYDNKAPVRRMILTYDLWFDPNFDWGGQYEGGKLPGIAGGSKPTGGTRSSSGFTARFMWRAGGRLAVYAYHQDRPSNFGEDFDCGVFLPRGRWVTVRQEVICNTGSNFDGGVNVWVDGTQVLNKTGIRWRLDVPDGKGCDAGMYSVFHGGSSSSWAPSRINTIDFDNWKLETEGTVATPNQWPAVPAFGSAGGDDYRAYGSTLYESQQPPTPATSSTPINRGTVIADQWGQPFKNQVANNIQYGPPWTKHDRGKVPKGLPVGWGSYEGHQEGVWNGYVAGTEATVHWGEMYWVNDALESWGTGVRLQLRWPSLWFKVNGVWSNNSGNHTNVRNYGIKGGYYFPDYSGGESNTAFTPTLLEAATGHTEVAAPAFDRIIHWYMNNDVPRHVIPVGTTAIFGVWWLRLVNLPTGNLPFMVRTGPDRYANADAVSKGNSAYASPAMRLVTRNWQPFCFATLPLTEPPFNSPGYDAYTALRDEALPLTVPVGGTW